jgi:DNA-binding transcriptional LysR family regulator
LGIAALPRYVAIDSLASGHVVELFKEYALPEQEIHAVLPSPKPVPGKVQAFHRVPAGAFRRALVGGRAEGVAPSGTAMR